jgi:excisionase family DNA binding protein
MVEQKQYLTPMEVSLILGTNYQNVSRWVRHGEIPHVKIGNRMFIPKTALENMLVKKEVNK